MRKNDHTEPVSHLEHVHDSLVLADSHGTAAEIALLRRRDNAALREASELDRLVSEGSPVAPLAGLTLTVKACFDVAGWVTHAGSSVLAEEAPADVDAAAVSALREAGAVLIAQTNMTEFAYGALGLNDTYGTPTTPLYPHGERVSGGSTSGGAVAVALGIADVSLGSDTSGSVRIPAAFCGVAGFKPSRGRYPGAGMLYLSTSFDVPGIVATSAEMCRRVDAALTGRSATNFPARSSVHGLRLLAPVGITGNGVDPGIVSAFEEWIAVLAQAGAKVTRQPMPCIMQSGTAAREGGIISAEAYMQHRERLQASGHRYDQRVGPRISAGADVRAHSYAAGLRRLAALARQFDIDMADADADVVVTPTVPILPPRVADLQTNEAYLAANTQAFRLTEFANRLDLPSISVPGDLGRRRPFGLLITGRRGRDADLLETAVQIERCLSRP